MSENNPHNFLNRESTWLEFNSRVLHEAVDKRTPLLERLRFQDIFISNNDEFFMKRIGHLKNLRHKEQDHLSVDGKMPEYQLEECRKIISKQIATALKNYTGDLESELKKKGIALLSWGQLNKEEKKELKEDFKHNIYPLLTPLAVDHASPFPFISNLSRSFGLCLRRPGEKTNLFARLKIPKELGHWKRLESTEEFPQRFIAVDEVISHNMDHLFFGMEIKSKMIFRVTRSLEVDDDTEEQIDLLQLVEDDLKERRLAPIVRVEVEEGGDPWINQFLLEELNIEEEDLFKMPHPLFHRRFPEITSIKRPELKYKKVKPRPNPEFEGVSPDQFFDLLKLKDHLFHFPYESYSDSVERFIRTASEDPKVQAIKMILYRTDTTGNIIQELIEAAQRGKQVACIIELKARFDEERNIHWAHKLEEAGVHVTYGLADFKIHAKMILVVRKEAQNLQSYAHIGTGNFNVQTSNLYTDVSYFTTRPEITIEVIEIFNFLTGRSLKKDYSELLVAPFSMHKHFINSLEKEIKIQKKGGKGRIIAKFNGLEEPLLIMKLYEASQAGVLIDLIVRGFCCLKPGVKGLSENIQVVSIVGQLLEHSRIYYFGQGKKDELEGEFLIGSADWMYRNQFNRIEVIAPIKDRPSRKKLWQILDYSLKDNRNQWVLNSLGTYKQRVPKDEEFSCQKKLLKNK